MKVCFASIIGRPNVGKSTLLNRIINYNAAIVSNTPQTTRNQITGVLTENGYQLIFVDTPGIHKPINLLGEFLNKDAFDSLKDIDCLLFLSPANEKVLSGDKLILEKIKNIENKIAVISKIDLAKTPEQINEKISELQNYNFKHIVSISENNFKSIESLIQLIKEFSYEVDPFYEEDFITDKTMRFISKEIIRESAINLLHDELPHSIAVEINDFFEYEDFVEINATIFVKKRSQKGILIGKDASMIKKIGTISRKKIQNQLGVKVVLKTNVKVAEKWVDDKKILKRFGYFSE